MRGLVEEKGIAIAWLLVTLPAILIVMGLVLDLGVMLLRHQQLNSASDAAALAATEAWDRDHWLWYGEVKIDPGRAESLARSYLKKNMPQATMTEIQVSPSNRVHVRTEMTVPFFFLRILGWTEKPVESYSTAVRRHAQ
jgi:hypothetical protein